MALTQQDILAGLRALGVKPGMVVMAHSALSSFGEVAGGADAVIDALIEAVGPQGTLLVRDGQRAGVRCLGREVERGHRHRHVLAETRSHPQHPSDPLRRRDRADGAAAPRGARVAADSPGAGVALGADREAAGRLRPAAGCDQDRNTLLHCAEEAVDAPYLTPLQREYLDESREKRSITLNKFPGPHRDFIGLDHVFRERGVMRTGKIGKAACRLVHRRH